MFEVRTNHGGEQPCTDDVVALRTHIKWEHSIKQIVVVYLNLVNYYKTLIYFEKHKVRTKKHIVYAMWIKLVRLFLESKHLNNFLDVELRVQRIQEKNQLFKHEKTVLSNLPSKNF